MDGEQLHFLPMTVTAMKVDDGWPPREWKWLLTLDSKIVLVDIDIRQLQLKLVWAGSHCFRDGLQYHS